MNTSTMIRLAARNTLRRKARTALTVGMVVVSVGLLVLARALLDGVFGAILSDATGASGHVRLVTPEFAQKEELFPLYAHLANVDALANAIAAVPGVTGVEPRLATGVTVTVGQDIGDVFALSVGGSERYFRERLRAKDQLVAGAWFTGAADELIAGAEVARRLGAKPGDELVLLGTTQDGSMSPIKGRLVGVVHGGLLDQQILVPMEKMQFLTDIAGGATELLVYCDDLYAAKVVGPRIAAAAEAKGLTVQAWFERDPWRTFMGIMDGMNRVFVFILGLLTALGVWNTMTMSVLERTSEIGVLRAMGMSRARVVVLVVAEAVTVAVVGGVVGLVLGGLPAQYLATHGMTLAENVAANATFPIRSTMYASLTTANLVSGLVLGLAMAFFGSIVPALRAASIPPVAAMRSGR